MSSPGFAEEVESLLEAFRQWLYRVEEDARAGQGPTVEQTANSLPSADLHSLVAEMTALRGEVRVGNRGAKMAREKMEHAANAFSVGLDRAHEEARRSRQEGERFLHRTLSSLVRERDDLKERVGRLRENPLGETVDALFDALESMHRGMSASEEARRALGWRRRLLPRRLLGGLLDGCAMARRRLEAALESLGVVEIRALGESFDPRRMRAVDTEPRDDVPAGQVVEVVRRGYRHGERVLRPAEVRTAVPSDRAASGSPS